MDDVEQRPRIAVLPLLVLALLVGGLLAAFAGRYGYHRDELYFVVAGQHPAWGYVDQPPLVPLLARAMDAVAGDALWLFRLPSAVAMGLVVLLTGLIARELGGSRGAQLLAAASMGVAAVTYAVGHLLSTATFDLLTWTLVSWLLVRALRDGGPVWLAVGVAAGVGLEVKLLLGFLLAAVAVSLLLVGPWRALRSGWLWLGLLVAAGLAAPHLVWQAQHDWPQLALGRAIADGSSGTSESRAMFVPFQLVMVSAFLVPVWLVGWWQLLRAPALRPWRLFAVAYVVLLVAFVVTAGKPYYLAGLYPVLLAAGAGPTVRWASRGWRWLKRPLLGLALAASLAGSVVLFLPVVPADELADTPVLDVNYDAGETVGWPAFADTVAAVTLEARKRGTHTIVLTENYGQAGAMQKYAPDVAPVYSGHNAFADFGRPTAGSDTVVAVGFTERQLLQWFAGCERAATVDNGVGLDNDEQGTPVWICDSPLRSWPALWSEIRRVG